MAGMRRRDPHKERRWRQLVAQWQASGLSIRAFCASRGLSDQSLYWWRRELAARDRQAADACPTPLPSPSACFVPVRLRVDEVAALPASVVEIVLGNGRRLRVGNEVPVQRLAELVHALEASAC
jgi:transposase